MIKTSTTVAALALSLAASCVMAQGGSSTGTSGYGSTSTSGSLSTDPSLDTMPPTSSGTMSTDTAPSSINPDKGPHGATKVNKNHTTKARPQRRSGDTDPRDPHQVNGAMDSESPSGTPSR